MSVPLSIDQLCAKYENEDPHTEHVAALAMRLFDLTREELGLTDEDRELLCLAALLHDIGHAADPANHPKVSADIVLQERPSGMSVEQSRLVAGIVRLHSGNPRTGLRDVRVRKPEKLQRIQQLASLLRVADGLDHSHIQDSTITGVETRSSEIVVSVLSRWYGNNVPWAEKKAGLWREVMPLGIRFQDLPTERKSSSFSGVVDRKDQVLDACRRILMSQYRIVADRRAGALIGDDPEYLHDIRVALRRFRAALHIFRPYLKKTEAKDLDDRLAQLGDDLGPIRDMQVWIDFLNKPKIAKRLSNDAAWPTYLAYYSQRNQEYLTVLRDILGDDNYYDLGYQIVRLLKEELPARTRARRPTPLRPFAAKTLKETFQRITAQRKLTHDESSEEMHDLRRVCRKERYWAEFLAPALGSPVKGLARRLKAVADALGDVHDMDLRLAALTKDPVEAPVNLANTLTRLRNNAVTDFRKSWKRLNEKSFRSKVVKKLNKIQKKI